MDVGAGQGWERDLIFDKAKGRGFVSLLWLLWGFAEVSCHSRQSTRAKRIRGASTTRQGGFWAWDYCMILPVLK